MRFLHTSDWHVGRRIRGRDRSAEHRAVLSELIEKADEHRVDATLVAGDIFDTASPSPVAEEIVWKTLLSLADIAPVLVVAGNHDNPARLDAVAPMLQRADVTVVGRPRPASEGGVVEVGEAKVALLPFVSQRGIVKIADIMGADPDEHAGRYEDRMRAVVEALTETMDAETVNVLVSHLTVHGAGTGGGERGAHIFGYAIPAGLFPSHLSFVALGHLHRQQKMPHASSVWYSGSPLQLDFGEVSDQKGALLVEAQPGKPASVTEIPLSAGRRLVEVRGTLEQVEAQADSVRGAYVKVILEEKGRVGLADSVRAAIPDAVDVVLAGPTEVRRRRTDRQNLDPAAAFEAFLEERGHADDRVAGLFRELLDEAVSAGVQP